MSFFVAWSGTPASWLRQAWADPGPHRALRSEPAAERAAYVGMLSPGPAMNARHPEGGGGAGASGA